LGALELCLGGVSPQNPTVAMGLLTQQWRYLNLTRNSLYILIPAEGIMSYKQINLAVYSFV